MTTRLRKTFQSASNSDDDDIPENLDEEEQEKLIAKLRAEDDERNVEYKRFFLAVPSVSAIAYIPALMSGIVQAKLVSLLCITSLIATAYMLAFVPYTRPKSPNRAKPKKQLEPKSGPVQQYISYLNGALSLLCALNSITFRDKGGVHDGFWLLCLLPVVSFAIIVLARQLMISVDVDELETLRYGYKGA